MICKQCGNEVPNDAKFCGVCGTPNEAYGMPAEQPVYAQPADNQYAQPADNQYAQPAYGQPQYAQPAEPQYNQPQYGQQYGQPQYGQPAYSAPAAEDPTERSLAKSTLIFGILGIAFPCTFYLAFLGIIFGIVAMSKAKKYVASGYVLTGKAKVGKILGTVGMILGIVLTVILVFIIIAAIVAATTSSNYYSSYGGYYY